MSADKIEERVFRIAHRLALATPDFDRRIGPGKKAGNGVTSRYITALNQEVRASLGDIVTIDEQVLLGVKYSFDFWIPSEETAIEIALSGRNIVTEYEKDLFKAILAKDSGKRVRKLVIVGKRGTEKRQNQPGPRAIREWVQRRCGIEVIVRYLP